MVQSAIKQTHNLVDPGKGKKDFDKFVPQFSEDSKNLLTLTNGEKDQKRVDKPDMTMHDYFLETRLGVSDAMNMQKTPEMDVKASDSQSFGLCLGLATIQNCFFRAAREGGSKSVEALYAIARSNIDVSKGPFTTQLFSDTDILQKHWSYASTCFMFKKQPLNAWIEGTNRDLPDELDKTLKSESDSEFKENQDKFYGFIWQLIGLNLALYGWKRKDRTEKEISHCQALVDFVKLETQFDKAREALLDQMTQKDFPTNTLFKTTNSEDIVIGEFTTKPKKSVVDKETMHVSHSVGGLVLYLLNTDCRMNRILAGWANGDGEILNDQEKLLVKNDMNVLKKFDGSKNVHKNKVCEILLFYLKPCED